MDKIPTWQEREGADMITLPPPIHLRELPNGTRFMLMRTGQKYILLRREFEMGKMLYRVQKESCFRVGTMHHSCHVKPIVSPTQLEVI